MLRLRAIPEHERHNRLICSPHFRLLFPLLLFGLCCCFLFRFLKLLSCNGITNLGRWERISKCRLDMATQLPFAPLLPAWCLGIPELALELYASSYRKLSKRSWARHGFLCLLHMSPSPLSPALGGLQPFCTARLYFILVPSSGLNNKLVFEQLPFAAQSKSRTEKCWPRKSALQHTGNAPREQQK